MDEGCAGLRRIDVQVAHLRRGHLDRRLLHHPGHPRGPVPKTQERSTQRGAHLTNRQGQTRAIRSPEPDQVPHQKQSPHELVPRSPTPRESCWCCTKKGCTPPKDGWTWDQIKSAQVKNLSGGKTYAAVFVTVAVVAVTVAVVAALASGKGGGGKLNLKGIFPRGVRVRGLRPRGGGGVRVRGLRPRGGSGVRVRGLRPRGGGGSVRVNRPHHHGRRPGRVHPPGNRNILDGLPQPDPGPGPDDQKTHSATDAERSAPPPPPPPPPPPGTSNQPPRARRAPSSAITPADAPPSASSGWWKAAAIYCSPTAAISRPWWACGSSMCWSWPPARTS